MSEQANPGTDPAGDPDAPAVPGWDVAAIRRLTEAFFEFAGVEVFMKDLRGRYLFANTAFRSTYGPEQADLVGLTDFDLLPAELAAEFLAEDQAVARAGEPLVYEGDSYHSGAERIYRMVKFPVRDEAGNTVAIGGVATEISDSVHARAALAATERAFYEMFSRATEGGMVVDLDGVVEMVNEPMAAMLGRPAGEIVGRRVEEFHHSENPTSFKVSSTEALHSSHTSFEKVYARPDGTPVYTRMSAFAVPDEAGRPVRILGLFTDETEQRRHAAELRRMERLDAAGQVAGSIAHDINNLLGGILGYAELMQRSLDDDPELAQYCEQVITAALRASEYTTRLLSLSRSDEPVRERYRVHTILDEVVQLLRGSVDPQIEVLALLAADRSDVVGNPSQLHGALLNLGLNAADAIDGAGRVEFRTETLPGDAGDLIRISVADTGAGIAPELHERVFEPFFSTKPAGRGTGLGLTSVLAAANQHGGSAGVSSTPGEGSTFTIDLPLATPQPMPIPMADDPQVPAGTTVLVVDDDEVVRYVVAEALRRVGCEVTEAGDGTAAIAAIEAAEAPPEAMVFDLRMPGMGGTELFRAVGARWPDVCAVLMSGFGGDVDADGLRAAGVCAVLQKPFKAHDLVATLGRCLGARG